LSKRRVSATDIAKCEERYNKSKAVHSIMSTVAKKENKDLEALYEQLAWPLYSKYGHAYDAFKAALKYVSGTPTCGMNYLRTNSMSIDYIASKLLTVDPLYHFPLMLYLIASLRRSLRDWRLPRAQGRSC